MYIDMGEKNDWPSVIIEATPPGPLKYIYIYLTLWPIYKNGFSIVFPCCTYVSTVMRSEFSDILVPPVPLDLM